MLFMFAVFMYSLFGHLQGFAHITDFWDGTDQSESSIPQLWIK